MKSRQVFGLTSLAAVFVLASSTHSAAQVPIHRWSFNNPASTVPDGTVVTDSIGGADGLVRGAGANFTGTGVSLPGGSSATAAYVDLPNGLISGHTQVTIEGWFTVDGGGNNWARIFDFGSSDIGGGVGGEVFGPGGGGEGKDYLMLSASRGTDYNGQRVEWRNEDPAGGGALTVDSNVVTVNGQQFHFAVTVDSSGGASSIVNYWRDGVLQNGNVNTAITLGNLNDVNNWLGRSNWTGDANTNGTYNEFRIYDTALTEQQVLSSMQAGPNGIVPEPSTAILALVGLLGCVALLWRRRRR